MRDDRHRWTLIDPADFGQGRAGVRLEPAPPLRQTLVSGAAALTRFERDLGPAVGWPAPARGHSYAVALRRDRALLVNGPSLDDGWDAGAGLAISDMSGGYAVFDLSGAGVADILRRGTEIDPNRPSRSAARLFAGFDVVLYHLAGPECVRFHVDRAQEQAFLLRLRAFLEQLDQP